MTKSSRSQKLLCFQHCKEQNLFSFRVPDVCPLCGRDTETTESRVPPFQLPCPFVDSTDSNLSIVVKPTSGSFLRDYRGGSNLHIGLTNSRGYVYDFDENGVHMGLLVWQGCVAVPLKMAPQSRGIWDQTLHQFAVDWNQRYTDSECNCFTFVLEYLKHFGLNSHYTCLTDKVEFCEQMIVPETAKVAKYISLHKQVEVSGVVVQDPS